MKNILIYVFCFTILSVITGCTKSLDLSPRSSISDASYWKLVSDFEKGANSFYGALPGFSINLDRDADIAFNNANTTSNSKLTTPDTDSDWNNAYTRIRNCNNLMERAAASGIADDVKVYVAEAKFFIAFNYWNLYCKYGRVPIVTKVLDIDSQELFGERATAQETVDHILRNLQECISDLPEESEVSAANKGRITKGVARAMIARVALFEGTWRKFRNEADANVYLDMAIEAANAVISSGQYALFTGQGELSYLKLFDVEGNNSSESILDRRYEFQVSTHSQPQSMQQTGYLPTKQLADMYLCMDGLPIDRSPLFQGYELFASEFENRDPRMSQTILIPGTVVYCALEPAPMAAWPFYPDRVYNTGYIIYKYKSQVPEMQMVPNNNQQYFHRHLIRYAEVLLTLAEALYERNGNISDDDLNRTINVIRQRAGLTTPLTNAFVTENNLDMRTELRRERTIELALEGFRRDDLRRWKTAETELVKAIRGIKIVGTEWAEPVLIGGTDRNQYGTASWQNRTDADGFIISEAASERSGFDPAKHYVLPIPAREIAMNPNLEQNPGW